MNSEEAKQFLTDKFSKLIHDRFVEVWPDTFVKARTTNGMEYANANGNMYSWYIAVVRSLSEIPHVPGKYEATLDNGQFRYDYIIQMYEDFKSCDNPSKWLMENLYLKYS